MFREGLPWWGVLCTILIFLSLWGEWPQVNWVRLVTVPIFGFIAIYGCSGPLLHRVIGGNSLLRTCLSGLFGAVAFILWWRFTQ